MASMDVFKSDAFSMMSLIKAVENAEYKPQFLGSLDLFEPEPIRTRVVAVESDSDTLSLIPTSPIGAPLPQRSADKRTMRNFNTVRLAKGSRITADQVQDIRAVGSESELQMVQDEVSRRMNKLMRDLELTWEHHRLGAIQGIVLDSDGSAIVNYFTEFGVTQPTEVSLAFGALSAGEVRPIIEAQITRPMIRAAKGAFTTGSQIYALCGDDFWDAFVNHAEIRTTYLNHQAAAALRSQTAFGTFQFAGVNWINYRGTDDGSTVAISDHEAKFFADAPGLFQVAWAPSESMDAANMPGRDVVPMIVPDPTVRNAYVDVEVYSYPLFICTKPLTLRRAVYAS